MKKELLKGLNEKQIAKIKACKNQEEILKLAKEEGIELSEEQLEAVSGGCSTQYAKYEKCPVCGCDKIKRHPLMKVVEYECCDCGFKYIKD